MNQGCQTFSKWIEGSISGKAMVLPALQALTASRIHVYIPYVATHTALTCTDEVLYSSLLPLEHIPSLPTAEIQHRCPIRQVATNQNALHPVVEVTHEEYWTLRGRKYVTVSSIFNGKTLSITRLAHVLCTRTCTCMSMYAL